MLPVVMTALTTPMASFAEGAMLAVSVFAVMKGGSWKFGNNI